MVTVFSVSVSLCLQRALRWTRSWPPSSGAVSTWGRPSCESWRPTRTTTATTSWLRSGRASGWRRSGPGPSSRATPRASPTPPTPWPAASTRLWGGSKRPRPSPSPRTRASRALTGRTSPAHQRNVFFKGSWSRSGSGGRAGLNHLEKPRCNLNKNPWFLFLPSENCSEVRFLSFFFLLLCVVCKDGPLIFFIFVLLTRIQPLTSRYVRVVL